MMEQMNPSIVSMPRVQMTTLNVHFRANVSPTKKYAIILKIAPIWIASMALRLMKHSKYANSAVP